MTIDQPLSDPNATGVFADRFAVPDVTPASPTTFALPGMPYVELTLQGIYGTLTIGPSTVPIRLSPPVDGLATIDVGPGNLTPEALSAAARSEAPFAPAADPLAGLPASLAAAVGGAVISHVRARVDLTARRLTAIGFDVVGHRPWTLLPGRLAVTDLDLSVNVHPQGADGGEVSGALTGTLTLGGTDVPVVAVPAFHGTATAGDATRSSDMRMAARAAPGPVAAPYCAAGPSGGTWSVVLDSVDAVQLSALRDLAGLLGEDGIGRVEAHMATAPPTAPAGPPGDGPLGPALPTPPALADLAIDLSPSGVVDAVTMTLDVASAPPRGDADSIARRSVTVEVRHPTEGVSPVVTVTVDGEACRRPQGS